MPLFRIWTDILHRIFGAIAVKLIHFAWSVQECSPGGLIQFINYIAIILSDMSKQRQNK